MHHSFGMRSLSIAIAALLLAFAVSAASANRLSLSSSTFTITFRPLLFESGGDVGGCNVTFSGSFHSRTIVKTRGALIGYVNRATLDTCAGFGATVLTAALPFHVRYNSFRGTLPNITGVTIDLVGFAFNRVYDSGALCLARTDADEPLRGTVGIGAGGAVGYLRVDETAPIDLDDPSFFCDLAGNGFFAGNGPVSPPMTLRLI